MIEKLKEMLKDRDSSQVVYMNVPTKVDFNNQVHEAGGIQSLDLGNYPLWFRIDVDLEDGEIMITESKV